MKKLASLILLALVPLVSVNAQTFTSIALVSPTLVSAPSGNLKPGALYKYANAAPGIDAYVKYVKTSNTGSDNVGLFAFDNLASVNNPGGYDSAFQPVSTCSGTNSSGLWTRGQCGQGYVRMSYTSYENYLAHFTLYFKKAGTNTDTALNFRAAFIDIDGFGSGTEAEQNAFTPGVSWALSNNTTLTITQRPDGLINAEGKPNNVGGISLTATTAITQVTYLNRSSVDFAIGMNTHYANNANGCYDATSGGRLASISFSSKVINLPVVTSNSVTLSGTVWDDADGSANNTFSNIKTGAEVGTNGAGVYVYALDSATGIVVGKDTVNANGTWSIADLPKDQPVKLLLSSTNVPEGTTNVALTGILNTNWVATSPLLMPSFRPLSNTGFLDFGIEQLPTASSTTGKPQKNPNGTLSVVVPGNTFVAADVDGTVTKIKLSSFPSNATSFSVGTTTYYPNSALLPGTCPTATCSVFPSSGLTLPTNSTGQPSSTIKVDPIDGTVKVVFPFYSYDNANQGSLIPGAAIIPFNEPLPPIAQNIVNEPINNREGQTHIAQFVASDPQGDPILSYKVLSLPASNTGTLYTCTSNSVPCTGSYSAITINQVLTPAQIKAMYFDPLSSFMGTASFTYSATSINGVSNIATEIVPIVNTPPTANSFFSNAVQKNSVDNKVPSLSGSDTDGVIVIYRVNPVMHGTLSYDTISSAAGPISGPTSISPREAAHLYYTPDQDYVGLDTFTYNTIDNNGLVSTLATVIIPVTSLGMPPVKIPPVTQNITFVPVNSNSGNTLLTALIGSDPDGTVVSYTITEVPDTSTGVLYYCTSGDYPCTGTLTKVTPNTVLTPNQSKTLQFDPKPGNNNNAVFAYTATDNDTLVSNTSHFTIPIINQPPVALSVKENVPFNSVNYPVPPLQGFDRDGTISNYTITTVPNATTVGKLYTCSNNTFPCTGSYNVVTANQLLSPAQVATLTFTPTNGFIGNALGTYTVTDNNGNVSVPAPIVLVVDSFLFPGFPPIASGSIVNMGANDGLTKLPNNFIKANDADGTITNFTVTNLPPANQGVYTYCPSASASPCTNAVTLNQVLTPAQAQSLAFTPEPTFSGPSYLGFYATDNDGNVSNTAFSIVNVHSLPPIAIGYTTSPVVAGGPKISTPIFGIDSLDHGSVVSYMITGLPETGNGVLTYCTTPPSSGCNTPLFVGTVLTPAQAATVAYTPGTNYTSSIVYFTFLVTDNSGNQSNVATIVIPRKTENLCIKPRVYLEGSLYNNGSATASDGRPLMRDQLRVSPFTGQNYIPVKDPYEFAAPLIPASVLANKYVKMAPQNNSYPQFQQVTDSATVFGVSGQNAIVDWVFVELRSKSNNASVMATRAALIQRDGDIVDVDGQSCVSFPSIAIDSYYVAIRHRSHLGTMTKYAIAPDTLRKLVDFSVSSTQLYDKGIVSGFNFAGLSQKENVKGSYRAMWQGDIDVNGKIKYDNPSSDNSRLYLSVVYYPANLLNISNYDFGYGYIQGDWDMNSKVKYDNPGADRTRLYLQVLFYPINTLQLSNFDFLIQQLP